MAHVFSQQNQVDSALGHYRHAVEQNSKYSKAIFNMALLFGDRQQYDSAAECYEKSSTWTRKTRKRCSILALPMVISTESMTRSSHTAN